MGLTKTVIIYKSKTGFTKKYAEWLADDLKSDIMDAAQVTLRMLRAYDTIIYGGGLYVVGINGVKLITGNVDKLKDKKIVVFATGVSPFREEAVQEVKNKNFTAAQQEFIQFFYLRGGFDYGKLKPLDKMLMTLLKWKIKWKKELTADEKGMLGCYNKPVDFTRRKNTAEIITYVNSAR